MVPPADSSSKSNGDVIVIDEDSESEGDEKRFAFLLIFLPHFYATFIVYKYVIHY